MIPQHPQIVESRFVFRGRRIEVHSVSLQGTDGSRIERELIVHPGAVVVLPLLDDQHVVMIRNDRFAVNAKLWELPAGTLEPAPETPESCAHRELIEEAGYRAGKVQKLTEFYTTPGFCTELMHAYLATDLTHVGQELEENELIEVEVLPYKRVREMMRQGEIKDGKSLATLLHYDAFVRQ